MLTVTEYGPGGYDPNLPNNNVVNTFTVQTSITADNAAALWSKAQAALTNNQTFLAITSPTNAQIATQVKALTRQVNALIRMRLEAFDSISDT